MPGVKRVELQWLRAIAAIEVVICHSDLVTKHFSDFRIAEVGWYQPLGGTGVELFFILSGYVICMRVPSYASGGAFIMSRIRRLFPLYWAFTTLVLLTCLVNPEWRLNDFPLSFNTFLHSYFILPQWDFPILSVGWTLEHEMIFYGIVALGMLHLSMGGSGKAVIAWVLALMGFVGAMTGAPKGGPLSTFDLSLWGFHLFSPYMFAFAFGWLLRCTEEMSPAARWANLGLFAAAMGLAFLIGSDYGTKLVFRIAFVGLIFWAFVHWRGVFQKENGLSRFGTVLGDASFSVYLCHWFVLSALGKMLGELEPPADAAEIIRVAGIAFSVTIGVSIYIVLEKPLDVWLRRGAPLAEIPWLGPWRAWQSDSRRP